MSLRAQDDLKPIVRQPPPQRARRTLDEVLRAGRAVGPTPVTTLAKPSSLTESLKAMQVTPTGAPCVPLTFDPDYCSGDKFYAFGMAVVSTAVGALTAAAAVSGATTTVSRALEASLHNMFYTKCRDVSWFDWLTYRYTREILHEAPTVAAGWTLANDWTFADTPFCKALAGARNAVRDLSFDSKIMEAGRDLIDAKTAAQLVAQQILCIIFAPVVIAMDVSDEPQWGNAVLYGAVRINNVGRLYPGNGWSTVRRTWNFNTVKSKLATFLGGVINMKWVQMIASKMNEMARGVASYMRVNFKQYLRDKTLYETNPLEFSRRILYDIVEDDAPEAEPGSPGSPPPLEQPGSPYTPHGHDPHGYQADFQAPPPDAPSTSRE